MKKEQFTPPPSVSAGGGKCKLSKVTISDLQKSNLNKKDITTMQIKEISADKMGEIFRAAYSKIRKPIPNPTICLCVCKCWNKLGGW